MSNMSPNDQSVHSDVNGLQAVREARTHQSHGMLLDRGLPGGDGLVVLERLKGNRLLSAIPVSVVTGRDPEVSEKRRGSTEQSHVSRHP